MSDFLDRINNGRKNIAPASDVNGGYKLLRCGVFIVENEDAYLSVLNDTATFVLKEKDGVFSFQIGAKFKCGVFSYSGFNTDVVLRKADNGLYEVDCKLKGDNLFGNVKVVFLDYVYKRPYKREVTIFFKIHK